MRVIFIFLSFVNFLIGNKFRVILFCELLR